MKVVWTPAAQNDLHEIGIWLAAHYPAVAPRVEQRIRDVVAQSARWPERAPRLANREGVRVATLGHYPYKIFYRAKGDAIEVLHIRHAARRPWTSP